MDNINNNFLSELPKLKMYRAPKPKNQNAFGTASSLRIKFLEKRIAKKIEETSTHLSLCYKKIEDLSEAIQVLKEVKSNTLAFQNKINLEVNQQVTIDQNDESEESEEIEDSQETEESEEETPLEQQLTKVVDCELSLSQSIKLAKNYLDQSTIEKIQSKYLEQKELLKQVLTQKN